MKSKIYSFLLLLLSSAGLLQAQTNNVIVNGFNGYDGTPLTVAPGWYYSWNDSSAASRSFYPSAGNCGDSIPAYKFGLDSVTVISPAFTSADSLRFWMKGNGSVQDSNTFEIYVSSDSISWTLLASMDSISASAQVVSLPIPGTAQFVKFFFRKYIAGYNVGLDDIAVLKNSGVGIADPAQPAGAFIYPSPTSGPVNVELTSGAENAEVNVYDLLGNSLTQVTVKRMGDQKIVLDLSGHQPGFYFIRIKTQERTFSKRVTLQ